jgi:hypothetical protein
MTFRTDTESSWSLKEMAIHLTISTNESSYEWCRDVRRTHEQECISRLDTVCFSVFLYDAVKVK